MHDTYRRNRKRSKSRLFEQNGLVFRPCKCRIVKRRNNFAVIAPGHVVYARRAYKYSASSRLLFFLFFFLFRFSFFLFFPCPFPSVSGSRAPPNPVREIVEELANEATLFPARCFREKPPSTEQITGGAPRQWKWKKLRAWFVRCTVLPFPFRFSIGSIVRTGTVRSADRLPFCTLDTTLRWDFLRICLVFFLIENIILDIFLFFLFIFVIKILSKGI